MKRSFENIFERGRGWVDPFGTFSQQKLKQILITANDLEIEIEKIIDNEPKSLGKCKLINKKVEYLNKDILEQADRIIHNLYDRYNFERIGNKCWNISAPMDEVSVFWTNFYSIKNAVDKMAFKNQELEISLEQEEKQKFELLLLMSANTKVQLAEQHVAKLKETIPTMPHEASDLLDTYKTTLAQLNGIQKHYIEVLSEHAGLVEENRELLTVNDSQQKAIAKQTQQIEQLQKELNNQTSQITELKLQATRLENSLAITNEQQVVLKKTYHELTDKNIDLEEKLSKYAAKETTVNPIVQKTSHKTSCFSMFSKQSQNNAMNATSNPSIRH